ncbi:hypothetical protein CICLE_v10026931mg, partial [Citrus x clementina]
MKNLERVLQEFNSQKEDIEATLKAEGDRGKKPRTEVKNWLQNVQRINSKAQSIEQEVKKRKYFLCARLGKDVDAKIQEMKDCHQKGCSFISLVIDAPPSSGLILPTTTLVGENTKKIVKKVWEDLMGDKVTKIGVWGMGGFGKTAIMRHINNRPQEETNEFSDVIWVTVSQPLDLVKLQAEIAMALKLSLTEDEDKLAIFTVVGCMRGVDEIHEWRNALNELRGLVRSFSGINADVLGRLEFSYLRLKDKKVQHCFLYCALYPEDFAISKDELI